MPTETVRGFVEIDIVIRPIESPESCDAGAPAPHDGHLLSGEPVNGVFHGSDVEAIERLCDEDFWSGCRGRWW